MNYQIKKDDWFKFCCPVLEWLNPYPDLDCEKYAETLIKNSKNAGANTIFYVIDCGGRPLFNGSLAPKDTHIGDFDLIEYLSRRLHEEGMKFVAAQLGAHTLSYIAKAHPDWCMRDAKGKVIYGPGCIPLLCPGSGFGDYVSEELARIISKYPTDGIYVEGIYYTHKKCYCKSCRNAYRKRYGRSIPKNGDINDMSVARFYMDRILSYCRKIRKSIDAHSPETLFMTGVAYNGLEDVGILGRVDWKALGKIADVVTREHAWGYGSNAPLRRVGRNLGVMAAETKKPVFAVSWYSHNVDREYTARTREHMSLGYLEILLHGATPQTHTQNALEEAPKNVPALKKLHAFTEKVRPYLLNAEKINYASLLYDRAEYAPGDHFSGYYKALVENHVPVKVISRDDLNSDGLAGTEA